MLTSPPSFVGVSRTLRSACMSRAGCTLRILTSCSSLDRPAHGQHHTHHLRNTTILPAPHATPSRASHSLRQGTATPDLEPTSCESIASRHDDARPLCLHGDLLPTLVAAPNMENISTATGFNTTLRASNCATVYPLLRLDPSTRRRRLRYARTHLLYTDKYPRTVKAGFRAANAYDTSHWPTPARTAITASSFMSTGVATRLSRPPTP